MTELKMPIFFDVDGTLIRDIKTFKGYSDSLRFISNSSMKNLVVVESENITENIRFNIVQFHRIHIDMLKKLKTEGHSIIVWSGGGSKWSVDVVIALKLQSFVDVCMGKPDRVFDNYKDVLKTIPVRFIPWEKSRSESEFIYRPER